MCLREKPQCKRLRVIRMFAGKDYLENGTKMKLETVALLW